MNIIHTIKEVKAIILANKQQGKRIGLVPTMGSLHEGHLTLATQACEESDLVILSIFVNPTQFGPNEDFESYPRDLARDTKLAVSVGVDIIFAPTVEEMYPQNGGILIHAGKQATVLCGASRPHHFDGVLQVVAKLFNIIQPDHAYFGQKDAQQVAIIETMVRDYNFPVKLCIVPIVREEDGLAKSSRNVYLSTQERALAPAIYEALQKAKQALLESGNIAASIQQATQYIKENTRGRIDYISLLSYPNLTEATHETEQVLLAAAVYIGKTRLIDNVIFSVKGEIAHV